MEPGAEKTGKDEKIMMAILRDMGIQDWDQGVIHQMLEYSYR